MSYGYGGGPGYYQQQPPYYHPQPSYPPPPPQPQPAFDLNDPNVFRGYFRSGLQALTYNSKPIIQTLTILAHDHALRMASVVSEELSAHIQTTSPQCKLPALYLMDSIAKNIGQPYTSLFSRWLERTFLAAYRTVEPAVKIKMEELLGTWRTGGPNGSELFSTGSTRIQHNLEEALFGRGGRGGGIGGNGRGIMDNPHYVAGVQQRPSLATPQETAAVAEEIRKVLQLRQLQYYRDPSDQANQISIDALQKLEGLVKSVGVSSEQVYQIRQQLAALTPPEPAPALSVQPSIYDALGQMDPATLQAILAASQQPVASTSTAPQMPQRPNYGALAGLDVSSALRSLDPNVLASLGSLGAPQVDLDPKQKEQRRLEDVYEAKLFAGYSKDTGSYGLVSSDINKPKPGAYRLLNDDLKLQCSQCSARWLDTPRHRKILQKHLDRHFRLNNRLNTAMRAQSRSWFVLADEWVTPVESREEEQHEMDPSEDPAEIAKSTVVAPRDPSKSSKPCPICKEPFKSQWNEESEEFIWLDAKKVDNTIYHATCYAETKKARLATRLLKEEQGVSSRENTPVIPSPQKDKVKKETLSPLIKQQSPPSVSTLLPAEETSAVTPPSPLGVPSPLPLPVEEEEAVPSTVEETSTEETAAPALPFHIDSNLLQAVAEIVRSKSATPLEPSASESVLGKRSAEDAGTDVEQLLKKVKQEGPPI